MHKVRSYIHSAMAMLYIAFLCIKKLQHPRIFLRLNKPLKHSGSFALKTHIYEMCAYKNIPPTLLLDKNVHSDDINKFLSHHELPLIAKPNQSHQSIGVRLIYNQKDIAPLAKHSYLLQKYIPCEVELGIFFIEGKICGVSQRMRPSGEKYTKPSNIRYKNAPELLPKKLETISKKCYVHFHTTMDALTCLSLIKNPLRKTLIIFTLRKSIMASILYRSTQWIARKNSLTT